MHFSLKFTDPALRQHISWVWKLSVPAILTQISNIVMQYIDSAMVGKLGADASAAIGLVASSTWPDFTVLLKSLQHKKQKVPQSDVALRYFFCKSFLHYSSGLGAQS